MIVDCAAYRDGRRCGSRLSLEEARAFLGQHGTFVWIGLRMPSEQELADVQSCFELDGATPEDLDLQEAASPHQRPVLARDPGLTSLSLRTAHYNDLLERVALGELSVIAGRGLVVTLRYGRASPLEGVRHALEADPDHLRLGPQAVLASVVEQVVEDYGPALDGFERDAVEVEADVFGGSRRQPVQRLYLLKRQLRELLVVVDALQGPLHRLAQLRGGLVAEEVRTQLHETSDQLARVLQRARSLDDLLTAALDANLTLASLQQNGDMRRISAWVAIAAVPTMIAGVYGMNFESMPELGWGIGYPAVLLLMAVVCGLLYRAFRRSGWL